MKKSYFRQDGQWLKGNLHSHSTVSDGRFTPLELASMYAERGYDFLSITDHNLFISHEELPEETILLLTGVEHDIEYSPDKCTHIVGISCFGKTETGYDCRRYSKDELTDQQLVDMMHDDGQFVTLAHPVWSRMEPEEVLTLENLNAVEVFNNGTEHLCHGGNAEVLWEYMLRRGKHVFATASDDVHGRDDLFGGWIWVKAEKRSKEAILDALLAGCFYASNAPVIYDFGTEDGSVYINCSECNEIHFVTYLPRGKSFFAKDGQALTEASYKLTGREKYVRAICVDKEGHSAWTQPIFF